jgi:hypothetical protein
VTKEEIVSMPIEEYKNRFNKDPMEIINSLDNPSEGEIVQALLDHVLTVEPPQ